MSEKTNPSLSFPSLIKSYVSFIGTVNPGDLSQFQCVERHPKTEAQAP
jgi:hypothetical protein